MGRSIPQDATVEERQPATPASAVTRPVWRLRANANTMPPSGLVDEVTYRFRPSGDTPRAVGLKRAVRTGVHVGDPARPMQPTSWRVRPPFWTAKIVIFFGPSRAVR